MTKPVADFGAGEVVIHAIDAERVVLAGLLMHNDALVELDLRPDEFYLERNRFIFEAMRACGSAHITLVVDELQRRNRLEAVGGVPYLIEMMATNSVGMMPDVVSAPAIVPADIQAAARLVRETAVRRALAAAGHDIIRLAHADTTPLRSVLVQAESRLASVHAMRHDVPIYTISSVASMEIERQMAIMRSSDPLAAGIRTGLRDLDGRFGYGPAQPGELITLAARPGMGKTALALTCAVNQARMDIPVAIISLEMTRAELIQRVLARLTGLDLRALRTGQLSEPQFGSVLAALPAIEAMPISIIDQAALTVSDIRTRMQALVDRGVRVLYVDYLQLLRPDPGPRAERRDLEIAAMTAGLKAIAKDFGTVIYLLAQLNRGVEARADRRPVLADLRESGNIEQDSDGVILIYRDEYYNRQTSTPGQAELIIAKHRGGPTGTVLAGWDGSRMVFYDLDRKEKNHAA